MRSLLAALLVVGCGDPIDPVNPDATLTSTADAAAPPDGPVPDAPDPDAARSDAAAPPDGPVPDAPDPDAARSDAATPDAAVPDAAAPDGPPAPPPPNILFVISDDQRAESLDCMPRIRTLLREPGVTFSRNYATTPLCCPGRASVLTGRYAHNHGVLQNGDSEEGDTTNTPGAVDFQENGNEDLIVARWLKGAGYRTGFFGKYLNGYAKMVRPERHVPPYWDEWRAFVDTEYFYFQLIERGLDGATEIVCYLPTPAGPMRAAACMEGADRAASDGDDNYSTDVLKEQAVAFIRQAAADEQPFFLYFSAKAPHAPFKSPARYQPDPALAAFSQEALDRVASCPYWDWADRPASVLEADVSDKPEWIVAQAGLLTTERIDETRREQIASVLATEDALEEMLEVLDELGQRERTIVIYTGDNGYGWGEHGWGKKNCAYEGCSRVPLVVLDPRHPAGGREEASLTANVDLAPTLAELAGVAPPAGAELDGVSLAGIIQGRAEGPLRDRLLTECWGLADTGPGTHAAVRTERWKYVEYYEDEERLFLKMRGDGDPEIELYDLERDPHELENLARASDADLLGLGYDPEETRATRLELAVQLAALKAD